MSYYPKGTKLKCSTCGSDFITKAGDRKVTTDSYCSKKCQTKGWKKRSSIWRNGK